MKIEVEDFNGIASQIKNIDRAMQNLKRASLNRKAIVILLQKLSGENKRTIENVLYGLENLKKEYLND